MSRVLYFFTYVHYNMLVIVSISTAWLPNYNTVYMIRILIFPVETTNGIDYYVF